MAISDKTRKLLWGRSGNRCAICRLELSIDATLIDDASLVGEECHIASGQPAGPRHDTTLPKDETDSYDNLILLCRVHHKLVDDQHETYSTPLLHQIKTNHEKWVKEKLANTSQLPRVRLKRVKENALPYLTRLTSGRDVLNLVDGTSMFQYDHDELTSAEEVELVGGFIQVAKDWGELGPDLEPIQKVRAGLELTNSIREIEEAGFYVFGGKEIHRLEAGNEPPVTWPIALLSVRRKTSDMIVSLSSENYEERANEGTTTSP